MRIAVISPLVDRRHGTERAVAELVDRLRSEYRDDVELYAEHVSDLELSNFSTSTAEEQGSIRWHRVRSFPGPHLFAFLGWLVANYFARRRKNAEVIFSPGINALDADVILVHVVFHRVAELQSGAAVAGLRALHRRLYYALLCKLERHVYANPRIAVAAVSSHTARQLAHYFERTDVTVIPNGVDGEHFSPASLASMRDGARARWNLATEAFVLLLVGNDWRNKGLMMLLAAVARCKDLPIQVMAVGQDDETPFRKTAMKLGVNDRVRFCMPVADVRTCYAAADALAAPSLEDSFNLPVLEAMSCGLPVIASPNTGISEWLTGNRDCLLLKDPEDPDELASAIRTLATNQARRKEIANNAVETAKKFSWGTHAAEIRKLLVNAAKDNARFRSR